MINYFPNYFSKKAIGLYVGVLLVCNFYFFAHFLPLVWWLFGLVEVIGFFYFANKFTRQWNSLTSKAFVQKLFTVSLVIRLVWVFFSYFFYIGLTGQPFEFSAADSFAYHQDAEWVVDMIRMDDLQPFYNSIRGHYSDMGYPYYLGWQYWLTGESILIARVIKALLGAFVCVLIYKLATRNFGESVGRISAILCLLMPNLIYYSGLHLKEAEMVFLTVAFMERSDFLLRSKKYNFINILVPLMLAGLLFFFRTVLGATAAFALFSSLLFSNSPVLTRNKRFVIIIWILGAAAYLTGGKIATEVEETWSHKDSNQQQSMEFRAERSGGNSFAKYISKSLFLPIILVIPFPTILDVPTQENQMLLNGGNFVKNILSFFVIFAFYWIIKNRQWRNYTMIGFFTIGYLAVIASSAFAQSERFHQPALPFLMIFAAFGLTKVTKTQKRYFSWYMALIFVVIIGWSWIKLAGKGLI
jgi:hypothetical protein